ncbi:hypothetical protein G6F70_003618 [Rhizopus microsporus]|uniref:NmrA-like domain-containing protein n=2 Tax=Rhizopus TaxID=4842 RepID=A0A367K7A0_RHIAZ|nr:hypothetical protein G6F71_001882 [Rhizopus microsporus]RCH98047.1 hypothetical protein CU097_011048 [Rhizopus azygosporus]KAG1200906.1 hypothetical protein G6F70_003618 [Rhizopus microsporus]KAG1212826.1 hypothetical protein G6F69_003347 [Rhizopus microsporus]KAG1234075.1 hypothetical protein G6F67_003794 [Rhizopus microsporus]
MVSTILVVGATGSTGKGVMRNLPTLLESKNSKYRILGLTRSLNSPTSQKLAELPFVEMQEKDWTTIDADWLKEQEVVRVYIAPHNLPHQFLDESAFYNALLQAGVKYVVKVSTVGKYVSPTSPVFYGRSHWASENLLSQPEFKNLQWTSLQPNLFTNTCITSAVAWIKQYQKTGNQETLNIMLAADTPVALINPEDVGKVGAHLLALDDPTPHNQAKYVLNGPEDITGKQIVEAVEQYAGVKAQDVKYESIGFLNDLFTADVYPKTFLSSFLAGCGYLWRGECSTSNSTTSKEIIELAPPKLTLADTFKAMMEE